MTCPHCDDKLREAMGDAPCERCSGLGEIVTDWDGYLHPPKDAPADNGVADCPDCDGTGRATLRKLKGEE